MIEQDVSTRSVTRIIEDLQSILSAALREGDDARGGILCVGLDQIASVRERAGYRVLDALMVELARRIRAMLGEQPRIYRLGLYRLVLALPAHDREALQAQADRLLGEISARLFEVGEEAFSLTASISICLFSDREPDADRLLVNGVSCFESLQAQGGNAVKRHEQVITSSSASDDDQAMLRLLLEALQANRLKVLFQPLMPTGDTPTAHFQMLPRLRDDHDELIAAAQFVPVAERAGILHLLDRWMVVRALSLIEERHAHGSRIRLLVNQSIQVLEDEARAAQLGARVRHAGETARGLVLEFRIGDVAHELKAARTLIDGLHETGVAICLAGVDDLAAALRTLEHVRADYLRLAPTMVAKLQDDAELARQFAAFSDTCRKSECRLIVPMVEDARTVASVWQRNIDFIQGNFIQQPAEQPDFDI